MTRERLHVSKQVTLYYTHVSHILKARFPHQNQLASFTDYAASMRTPLLEGSQGWECFHQEDCDTHRILRINGYYNDSHVAKKAAAIKKKREPRNLN